MLGCESLRSEANCYASLECWCSDWKCSWWHELLLHPFSSSPLPYPLSLTQLSSAAPGRVELESRLHELTESLIQKQTTLEALSSEKSSLNVQLQRMKVGYTTCWCWSLVQCLVLSFVRKVQHTIHNLNFLVVTGFYRNVWLNTPSWCWSLVQCLVLSFRCP